MRKRSKHRPKPVLRNPMAFVMENVALIKCHDAGDTMVTLQAKNHAAIEAVRIGEATRLHVDRLISMVNVTDSILSLYGRGIEFAAEIRAGHEAVMMVGRRGLARGRFLFTGPELDAVRTLAEIHDAQLEITTLGEMERAVEYVKAKTRSGHAKAITPLEASHAG